MKNKKMDQPIIFKTDNQIKFSRMNQIQIHLSHFKLHTTFALKRLKLQLRIYS